jgi:hypothetical protein
VADRAHSSNSQHPITTTITKRKILEEKEKEKEKKEKDSQAIEQWRAP